MCFEFIYIIFQKYLLFSEEFSDIIQWIRKVALRLDYGTWIWLSVSKLPLKCAVVSLYSAVKKLLKCNTGKMCCLIQFLLYRRSWTSLPIPFISAQRLTELAVVVETLAYPGIFFGAEGGSTNSVEDRGQRAEGRGQRERGSGAVAPLSGVPHNLQMSETRILIRLLRMYFPRN
jgi:hypothetical protein